VGGISVLRVLRERMPSRDILYVGDTANVPYGDKPLAVVRDLALALTQWLAGQGCRDIVMASGTSTAAGLDCAREQFPHLRLYGTVEPGARAALDLCTGPIGVIATNATVNSRAFTQAIHAFDPARRVVEQGCPRFVPLVETGRWDTPDATDAAAEYIPRLLAEGVEAVIYGCTHFPFLSAAIAGIVAAGGSARPIFVDPAVQLAKDIAEGSAGAVSDHPCHVRFACTGDAVHFREMASLLAGADVGQVEPLRGVTPAITT